MSDAPVTFISHASQDAALAQRLNAFLETREVRCWIAPRDLNPGQSYPEEIVRGINACASFILIVTAQAIASRNVMNELEQAHRTNRAIYPVMVGQPKLSFEISYYIARLHWLESKDGQMEQAAARLADVLHGTRRWEAVAAPPSFGRRLRYAMPAFAGALSAILLSVLVLAILSFYGLYKLRHAVATDYTSLGWTKLYTSSTATNSSIPITGHIFLGNAGLPFSQVRLSVLAKDRAGKSQTLDLTPLLPKDTTGDVSISFEIPSGFERLQTSLMVPASAGRFCVQQGFRYEMDTLQESGAPQVRQVAHPGSCK